MLTVPPTNPKPMKNRPGFNAGPPKSIPIESLKPSIEEAEIPKAMKRIPPTMLPIALERVLRISVFRFMLSPLTFRFEITIQLSD